MQLELGASCAQHPERHAVNEVELNNILAHRAHRQILNHAAISYLILCSHDQTSPRFQRGSFPSMSTILPWSEEENKFQLLYFTVKVKQRRESTESKDKVRKSREGSTYCNNPKLILSFCFSSMHMPGV
jgi:hypothetical protein